jgi:RHS repeat-associated protein
MEIQYSKQARITEQLDITNGRAQKFNYAYDIAGRLWKVWGNDTLMSVYAYDANGNRLSHWTPTKIDSGSYDAQDRLLSYSSTQRLYGSITFYLYTPNGVLSQKIEGTDTTNYTYDNFGNLTTVVLPNKDRIDYIIDGQNRRIGEKCNGKIVKRWIYSGRLTLIAELDSIGEVVAQFVGEYMIKNGKTYQLVTDHLGSVRLVVDINNGDIVQQIDYDEFGNVTHNSNPDFQPFAFVHGLYDTQTKLVRFGARDYDASIGRWTKKDPLGFTEGVNFYLYCENDPVNFLDPGGLNGKGTKPKEGLKDKVKQEVKRSARDYGIELCGDLLGIDLDWFIFLIQVAEADLTGLLLTTETANCPLAHPYPPKADPLEEQRRKDKENRSITPPDVLKQPYQEPKWQYWILDKNGNPVPWR